MPSPTRSNEKGSVVHVISKRFEFAAAHALDGLPPEHQCSRIHGHNYVVEVQLYAHVLRNPGFVRDYGELKAFKDYLDATFDHRWLGHGTVALLGGKEVGATVSGVTHPVVAFNPTAELLAEHFFQWLAANGYPEVYAVNVSETPKTEAWYRE